MGNEASDMDSIISSLLYGYLLGSKNKTSNQVHIAVMNIPREDFSLRTETCWIFSQLNISTEDLLFFPEIEANLDELMKKNRLQLILLDHNILAQHQKKFEKCVREIVDHHKDEKIYPEAKGDYRIIDMVGSCCTLVALKYLYTNDFNSTSLLEGTEGEKAIRLLVGTILLDTVNLDPKHKKVTPKDEEAVAKLSQIVKYDDKFRFNLFTTLQDTRFDQSSMSSYDLLRVDYKQWTMAVEVGIGSHKVPIKVWLQKDSKIVETLEKYLLSRKLDILFVMTAYFEPPNSDKFFRELLVYTTKKDLMQPVVDFLQKKTDLNLMPIEQESSKKLNDSHHFISFFNQGNIGHSRKQLQPFLMDLYSKK